MRLIPILLLAPLALTACPRADDDDTMVDPDAGTAWLSSTEERISDSQSTVTVEIEVTSQVDAFMVTAQAGSGLVGFERLRDPSGNVVLDWEDWSGASESLTWAIYEDRVNTLNWPVRTEDGPLAEGTWVAEITTTDFNLNYVPDTPVTVDIRRRAAKSDTDTLQVRIVYARGLAEDDVVVQAVEGAVERWRTVWAEQGLTLDESYESSDLDPSLGFAYTGSDQVRAVSAAESEPHIILVVGDQYPDGLDTFGVSAGLPGPLAATRSSYVTVSWMAHAGANLTFADWEVRMMGETMAHECGHYLGLFHPVETSLDGWDALGDTPQCRTYDDCERQMGDNNMYPYPICSGATCFAQGVLTDDQAGVMTGWTGVR